MSKDLNLSILKRIKRNFKENIRNRLVFFVIPLILLYLFASVFAAEEQIHTLERICFIGLIIVFGVFYRNGKQANRIISQQKELLEEKNREILDSIEYALRIQKSILPSDKIVKQYLENSFVLYKPKDIVAGDFYWMETLGDIVLFAACDCTGHGVPGALVSIVCHNALNRSVREFGLTEPAAILDKTSEIVKENFSKSEENINDGMDISLCAYNHKTMQLEWAGANNPLWIIKNQDLTETKADKQSIGISEDGKPFTNHSFIINIDETIYLFSDGMQDQFGGEGEKKFTKRRFKELLLSLQGLTLQAQGTAIDIFISDYMKVSGQTDDILVMGLKFGKQINL